VRRGDPDDAPGDGRGPGDGEAEDGLPAADSSARPRSVHRDDRGVYDREDGDGRGECGDRGHLVGERGDAGREPEDQSGPCQMRRLHF